MKKILALTLALVMALGLAACAPKGATSGTDVPPAETPDETAELKIAIVTSPSGVDDGSFNQDNYEGIKNFIKNHPNATVKAVQEPDITKAASAVAEIVADYDVIVTPGFQFGPITTIAQENPSKKFILVDSFPTDPADDKETIVVDNIYAMQFAEQESGFFAPGRAVSCKSEQPDPDRPNPPPRLCTSSP